MQNDIKAVKIKKLKRKIKNSERNVSKDEVSLPDKKFCFTKLRLPQTNIYQFCNENEECKRLGILHKVNSMS